MTNEEFEALKRERAKQMNFRNLNPTTQYRPQSQQQGKPQQNNVKPKGTSVSPKQATSFALVVYEWLDELFKSFGIITGGIATSLADWVFGAVTMTILLQNYTGFAPWMKWVAGGVFSLALWGIQIILWRVIITGKIKKLTNVNNSLHFYMYVAVFVGIAIMKFGDDFSDIIGVYWLIKENPMQIVLRPTMYQTLLIVIYFLTWCICGFAEVFVALSINLLKDKNEQKS